jgi:hypothetical protein
MMIIVIWKRILRCKADSQRFGSVRFGSVRRYTFNPPKSAKKKEKKNSQEPHQPRHEPVARPLEDPDERGQERRTEREADEETLEQVRDEEFGRRLVEAVFLLEDEGLVEREGEALDGGEEAEEDGEDVGLEDLVCGGESKQSARTNEWRTTTAGALTSYSPPYPILSITLPANAHVHAYTPYCTNAESIAWRSRPETSAYLALSFPYRCDFWNTSGLKCEERTAGGAGLL